MNGSNVMAWKGAISILPQAKLFIIYVIRQMYIHVLRSLGKLERYMSRVMAKSRNSTTAARAERTVEMNVRKDSWMCVMLSGERLLIRYPSREHVLEMLSKRFVVSALFAHAKRLENVNYSLNGGFIAVTFLVHCQFLFCSVYYFPTRIFNDTGCFVKIKSSKTLCFCKFYLQV